MAPNIDSLDFAKETNLLQVHDIPDEIISSEGTLSDQPEAAVPWDVCVSLEARTSSKSSGGKPSAEHEGF